MKRILFLCAWLVVIVSFSSCDKIKDIFSSDDDKEDPNVLSGDTDSVSVPLGTVGNEFSVTSIVGNSSVPVVQTLRITKNEGGMVTMKVVADLSQIPQLSSVISLIPSSMKDTNGRLNTDLIFKVTSNGIQDQMNKDRALHTMVKYDAAVGDEYKLSTSNGKTITRTVTAHSTTDDFSWGWLMIKTITVEQDSRMPGIRKIVYRFNHRFGLVYVEVVPETGTSASAYLYPTKY
jgi:hypothetical protein